MRTLVCHVALGGFGLGFGFEGYRKVEEARGDFCGAEVAEGGFEGLEVSDKFFAGEVEAVVVEEQSGAAADCVDEIVADDGGG